MKRYFEYGALSASVLTIVYITVSFFYQGYLDLSSILLSILGAVVSGLIVGALFVLFAPGEHIPEGEEDNYINS